MGFQAVLTAAALALSALAGAAGAEGADAIRTSGPLSDTDFYHLATCGARPDGDCDGPYVRWAESPVTIAMLPPDDGFPRPLAKAVSRALDRAIAEVNEAEAGIRLARRDKWGEGAQIVLTPSALREGDASRGLTNIPDGKVIGVGYMTAYWDGDRRLTRAGIAIASDIGPQDVDSVVLEELFQTLGFLYDIDNATYEGVSVLSENSNATRRIRGQDRAILRMHYPPG